MRKHNGWFYDLILIILIGMVVLTAVLLLGSMIRGARADAEVHQIMEDAQERIDAYEAAQVAGNEQPKLVMVEYKPLETATVEPVEDWYIESIPMDKELQKVLFDAACENGVDYFTALGLIQVESDFCLNEVNPISGCYGLCQLNPEWFPTGLSPEDNIKFGMGYLGQLLEQYRGDVEAALRAYNRGYDDGYRGYSLAVLDAAEAIMDAAVVVTK